MSCIKCKHINAHGRWKDGECVGKNYGCDLKLFEPQEKMPKNDDCESFDELTSIMFNGCK